MSVQVPVLLLVQPNCVSQRQRTRWSTYIKYSVNRGNVLGTLPVRNVDYLLANINEVIGYCADSVGPVFKVPFPFRVCFSCQRQPLKVTYRAQLAQEQV